MKENLKVVAILAAILILYGIAGRMDYDTQVAEEQEAHHAHIVAAQDDQP